MKMIRLLLVFTAFLVVNTISAQTNVTVNGHLTDISTSTPVPNHYVSVFVHPYSLGVAPYYADSVLTNSAGSYSFDFMLPTPVDSLFVLKVGTFECNGNWAHETFDNINGQTNFSADLYICDSIYQLPDCYCAIEGFGPGVENLTVYLHGYSWPSADAYNWDLGDGTYATGQDVIHTYSTHQPYIIWLTTTNFSDSCSYNAINTHFDLSNTSDCQSSFTYVQENDSTINFHATTTSQYPTQFSWDFGDGTIGMGQDISHFYIAPGTYTVLLTTIDSSGCASSFSTPVIVNDTNPNGCESSFIITQLNDPFLFDFYATTTGQNPSVFSWDFGDGTIGEGTGIIHNYWNFGTYQVTLNAIDNLGCTSTYTSTISITDSITPNGCDNYINVLEKVEHTVSLSGGIYSGQTASYFWDLGDGNTSTEQTFSHTYEYPGYHTISLETYTNDSCYDQTERTIFFTDSVYTGCDCGFITTPGNDPLTKIFQAHTTSIYPTQYTWSFADGTHGSGPSVSHTFGNNGMYHVQVRCQDSAGCICISSIPIMVGDSVDPTNCENWINILGITGHTINLYPVVVYGEPSYRFWDLGDGTTSTALEVTHTYAAAGLYTVTLQTQTWDGCTDQSSIVIHITDSIPNNCDSYFTALTGNNLNEIQFNGFTSSQFPTTWLWNFGDPASGSSNTSNTQNPMHTFSASGTYSVILTTTDSNNCSSTFSAPVILSMYSLYSLNGQVFADNQSITDCRVQLFSQDYTGSMNLIREVMPDSANYYKFDSVSSGIYHILAIPDPGTIYALQYLPTYFGDAFFWENSTPVVLGQPVNPYSIHLVDFDSISGGDGLINGELTTGGKSMIVGNQEILILDINNNPVKYMFSQADGSFSFEGLPYGEYKIYPVITGIKTYPVTVILSETNKSATVNMKISGQSVAGKNYFEISDLIENIYPNPTSGEIFISMKTNGAINIQIIDVSGKIVLSKDENSIKSGELFSLSLEELLKGLYLIVFLDDKGNTSSRRIIKN